MRNSPSSLRLALAFVASLALGVASTDAQTVKLAASAKSDAAPIRATWRPADVGKLDSDLDAAEALLNRRLPLFARDELDQIAQNLADDLDSAESAAPSSATLARYGVLALRAAIESAQLDQTADRTDAQKRLEETRKLVEGAAPNLWNELETNSDALQYAVELARAYAALGEFDPDAASAAKEFAKDRVLNSPEQCARPFLYRLAKIAFDERNFDAAEKFAKALGKSAQNDSPAEAFTARVLLVEIARERGDLEGAKAALASTLDAYKKIADSPDAPVDVPVALVAQEAALLLAEGQTLDAIRQVSQRTDLLGAPLPARIKRRARLYDDAFDQLEIAKANVFRTALRDDVRPDDADPDFKASLLAAAQNAVDAIESAPLRAATRRLARELGESASDYATARNAADELYRDRRWNDALATYDRAAKLATDAEAAQAAFEIRRVAAALVDKICREKLYETEESLAEKSPDEWRRDAAGRFDAVARAKLDDEFAPSAFLLALQYRRELGEDSGEAAFEFFDLFPTAPIRDQAALDLARASLRRNALDDAERAFDLVSDSPQTTDALLDLDAAIVAYAVEQGADPKGAASLAAERLLRKFAPAVDGELSPVRLDEIANRLKTAAPPESTLALLARACARLAASDLERDPKLPASLARLIEALRTATRARNTRATLDSANVALALAVGSANDALAAFAASSAKAAESTAALVQAIRLAKDASPETRRQIAEFVWNATDARTSEDRLASPARAVARAEAAVLLGKRQDALALFAQARKADPGNVDANRGIARLLAASSDPAVVERALQYWSDVADALPDASKDWWDAKEECVKIYRRLGKLENARKMTQTLWLTRSDPSDPDRKAKWEQMCKR